MQRRDAGNGNSQYDPTHKSCTREKFSFRVREGKFSAINYYLLLEKKTRFFTKLSKVRTTLKQQRTVVERGGGLMTTNGDFWGLMGTKNHGDSG